MINLISVFCVYTKLETVSILQLFHNHFTFFSFINWFFAFINSKRSIGFKLSLWTRFAQTAHQACCEPVKITAKFSSCFSRPLFIFYHIPEGYSAEPTRWWEFKRVCMLNGIGWWFLCSLTEDERNLWTPICRNVWKS